MNDDSAAAPDTEGLSPGRRHVYARLYTTTTLSLLGDAVASVGLPLAFLVHTGSVGLAATLAASTTIPQVLLALPASAISDRLPRKPVVTLSYLVEAVCLLLLAVMLRAGFLPLYAVVLLGMVRGLSSQLGVAASAGYIPGVLGRDALLSYHARVETVEGVAAIGGPPMAGAIVSALGAVAAMTIPAVVALINAAIYVALPAVGQRTRRTGPLSDTLHAIPRDVAAGVGYIRQRSTLTAVVLVHVSLGATTGSYVFAVVDHLRRGIGASGYQVGFVMAATGVGGIVGSLCLERLFPLARAREVLVGALGVIAVVLVSFGWTRSLVVAAVLLAVLDLACVACFIFGGTLQQYAVHDDFLARVEAINDLALLAGSAVAVTIAVRVVPAWGSTVFLDGTSALTLIPFANLLTRDKRRWHAELNTPR